MSDDLVKIRKRKRTAYSVNNSARLIRSGSEFFDALENLIDEARFEIYFQTYIFEEDETGQRVAHALIRAAQRGVKIFILLDAFGSGRLSEKFLSEWRKEKIEFRWFGPLFRNWSFHIGRRLHRKVVVADRFTSIVSGINISNNYNNLPANPAWLDFGVLVKGDVSKKLYLICKQSWLKIRFRRFSKKLKEQISLSFQEMNSPMKIRVRQNDWKIGKKESASSYYQLIRQARESLIIIGGYFLPGRKARRLLRKASKRGVMIRVIIAERSDVGLMRKAMIYLYDWLLRYNIRIFEYKPSNVHGKAIVSDKKIVSIGSYDLNTLSTYSNIELNLDIDDAAFASGAHQRLEEIIANDCTEVTHDILRGRKNTWKKLVRWFSYRMVKSLFGLSVWLAKKDVDEEYQ